MNELPQKPADLHCQDPDQNSHTGMGSDAVDAHVDVDAPFQQLSTHGNASVNTSTITNTNDPSAVTLASLPPPDASKHMDKTPTKRRGGDQTQQQQESGVNSHSLSPARLSTLMDENVQYIHQSKSTSVSKIPTSSPSPSPSGYRIVESTKNWLYSQRIRRQKKALERAVEEQRRILMDEQLKQAEAARHFNDLLEQDLDHNATFQSLTNQNVTLSANSSADLARDSFIQHNLVGPLCGLGSSDTADYDEEYVLDEEVDTSDDDQVGNEDATSKTHAEADADADAGTDGNFSHPVDEHGSSNPTLTHIKTNATEEDDVFRIRPPSHTHTGGLAVHLEFLQDQNQRPSRDLVKVFEENHCTVPFILSLDQMTDIAEAGLPSSIMFTKWKRLYSLQRDGDSFASSFLNLVKNQTKTLLVIETTNREVMGAYCNTPWECQGGSIGAQFYGSAQACLFSIRRDTQKVDVYRWTGRNRYIQVCDVQHKMIALGGGGKDGEFGLCVEDDFRIGSTGPCETFNNPPLCQQAQFEIMNVECWGFVSGFC